MHGIFSSDAGTGRMDFAAEMVEDSGAGRRLWLKEETRLLINMDLSQHSTRVDYLTR